MTVDEKNRVVLRRDPNFADIDPELIKTNVSVEDVVKECYRQGYFIDNHATAVPHNPQGTMIMATTTPMPNEMTEEATQGDKQGMPQQDPVFGTDIGGHSATELADAVPKLDLETITQSFGEYPFNAAFDPNATENYYFDPFEGYAFDAVDMNDLDNFNILDWVQEKVYEEENP